MIFWEGVQNTYALADGAIAAYWHQQNAALTQMACSDNYTGGNVRL